MLGFLRVLGVRHWGALIGGLVFAFGSFFITQIQHENLVRSAVWLPLVLLLVERAFGAAGWGRQRWLALAGLALAVAALGTHVQPGRHDPARPRALHHLPRRRRTDRRVTLGARATASLGTGMVTVIGLATAAVQLLPLFELGRMSYRGPGLIYELATAWPLRWQNLPTIVFPYLFRLDDGVWVTLWERWETFLYVGMAPLGLAVVGGLLARRRIVGFFILLGLLGLAVGLAEQSPLNVHYLLWNLPGFSSLRAPGRFAYLVVFALAGLAAFGVDWLAGLGGGPEAGIAVGGAMLGAAASLAGLAAWFRAELLADRSTGPK